VSAPPDIAYIVRPGSDNPELRYSLRTLRNIEHGNVWMFGHRPSWVKNVHHVYVPQFPGKKWENAFGNVRALAEQRLSEFILFNDDFFVVRWSGIPRPVHRGSLVALAAETAAARGKTSAYANLLRATADVLIEGGHRDPLAYTTHTPMMMTGEGLAQTVAYIDRHAAGGRLSPRSIYGNLMRLGGERIGDVKVKGDELPPESTFISTTDASFRYHAIGRNLRKAFPDPSPYEIS
jgi:hypothetical protein